MISEFLRGGRWPKDRLHAVLITMLLRSRKVNDPIIIRADDELAVQELQPHLGSNCRQGGLRYPSFPEQLKVRVRETPDFPQRLWRTPITGRLSHPSLTRYTECPKPLTNLPRDIHWGAVGMVAAVARFVRVTPSSLGDR